MRFRLSILELLGFTTLMAIAFLALTKPSDVIAHICVTCQLMLLLLAIAFIPSATGRAKQFLIAFVAGATVFRIYSSYASYSPFEWLYDHAWLALAQLINNPPPTDFWNTPRSNELIAFREIARTATELILAVLTGLLARSVEPSKST